ncbi:bifunctional DnaQ family exonuclease/ATP-dependent helicase [Streptococcus mutans]|nr:bifunctional DnaQ family exonuclease/ATP-dependent helicase [Streptococcus mutans]EMC00487.1 bifunctional ATP-dependent DNA helicase/DNA polymerase III subunit epsilon [Streptococcus mutans N34]MBT3147780.1 bifunctional DnaQ family exonuclease/ATP-dependent helicase [Streptococcus mutans]MBW3479153.1 bifunctional DnaQ family exonuclease/ATP-dependent helicase [Streptococcus mutans]MCB4931445.1 bifunctional DnaQ family exonuclease/ATP-dependent helicase [Streptococcus mutans]MCB5110849.1 bif
MNTVEKETTPSFSGEIWYNFNVMTEKKTRKYAVVDLEATGASHSASIIQVGIVIIENEQIIQTYTTDVNPHKPLSKAIIRLTGITDAQLQQAPDFSEVAADIYHLIDDCVFVAHNVKFDANLLAEHLFLEGFELLTPRVDTVELAQVFYPTFEKYSLGNLTELLKIDLSDAHTAIADAKATAELFLKLKQKMTDLPKLTLERILQFSDSLLYESKLPIEEAFAAASNHLSSDYQEVAGIVLKKEEPFLKERQLSQDFATNIALLDLEERTQQLKFAQVIEAKFEDSRASFIEAQSGIGKTYGYLLPLLNQHGEEQIIVSVPTKILQDQIMANEAQALREAFHINSHSLKSPQNYLKLDSFYKTLMRKDDNRLLNRYKMQLLVWLLETRTGDLDEIKQKQRYTAYFDEIRHDGTLSKQSLFYHLDFWQKSYQRAKSSRLLITNHAYLLTRIEDDQAFVENQILVIDEAQRLFLTLEQFSRRQINMTETLQTLNQLLENSQNILEKRLLESIQFELNHLLYLFNKEKRQLLKKETIERLRQHLSELSLTELADLQSLFEEPYSDFWFEEDFFWDHRTVLLKSARLDFTDFTQFLPATKKTYLVSATLQISPKVSLANLLGFEQFTFDSISGEKSHQQAIWVDKTMPRVNDISDSEYETLLTKRLLQLAQLKQPMLVLFNSKKTMFAVSDLLDEAKLTHLTQEKNGSPFNIKRRFDRGEADILLGTGGFWEGVDFVEQDRLIEVITRLPFDNPEDLFVKKLNRQLRQEGKNPFYDYTLPTSILRLRQAIGRTRRNNRQFSAIVILDSRVVNKNYGKIIYQALASHFSVSSQHFQKILVEVTHFLI